MKTRFQHLAETHQKALNNKVENRRKFTITCKPKAAGSKEKEVDYIEPFKFYSADEACITRSQRKQAKAVKYKLFCVNKSKWVSILNLNSLVDQSKIAFWESESELGVENVKSTYYHF